MKGKNTIFMFGMMLLMAGFVIAEHGAGNANSNPGTMLDNITVGTLTTAEADGLTLMREEEKLARDVYLALYETHSLPIFNNIASSEQTHMDAVLVLMERYNLDDSASSERGVFSNAKLQGLYTTLVDKGKVSLTEALIVGATVEDLDIYDLNNLLADTDKKDLELVYENLVKGSRNHIRSFVSQLESNGGTYTAQYITESELSNILSGSMETGSIIDSQSRVVPEFNSQLRKNAGQRDFSEIAFGNVRAQTGLNLVKEQVGERVNYRATLSNGRNAEIKIMPDAASEKALERLRLKTCSEANGCSIELKEVGVGNQTRVAYELNTQRNSKVLGIFNARMQVRAQVDAENGEVLQTNKPWWAFLASEPEE